MEIEFIYEVNDDVLHQEFVTGKCGDKKRSVKFTHSDLSEQSRKNLLSLPEIPAAGDEQAITSIWNKWEAGKQYKEVKVWLRDHNLVKDEYGWLIMKKPLMIFDHDILSLEEVEKALDEMANQWKAKELVRKSANDEKKRLWGERVRKFEEEQRTWINKYGSERLKVASSRGYDCSDVYIVERASVDFPNFVIVDENVFGLGKVKGENPSLEALKLEKELCKQGLHAEVSFVYAPFTDEEERGEVEVDVDKHKDIEVVVIREYLGLEIDLIKIV